MLTLTHPMFTSQHCWLAAQPWKAKSASFMHSAQKAITSMSRLIALSVILPSRPFICLIGGKSYDGRQCCFLKHPLHKPHKVRSTYRHVRWTLIRGYMCKAMLAQQTLCLSLSLPVSPLYWFILFYFILFYLGIRKHISGSNKTMSCEGDEFDLLSTRPPSPTSLGRIKW